MRELNEAFGQALRDLRLKANLAQVDFPPKVSREHVSLLERGLRSPSLETIDNLAEVMGISPLALVLQCYLYRDQSQSIETLIGKALSEVRMEMIAVAPQKKDGDSS
ncbi:helix-turn-helix domain-containing protein [Pseudomonas izuensis]|uniref:helix-turn-helix domain-containing protein n=1 Tax=Pseudomonas izuensis TaxID=2684212 RepID=UPI00135B25DD|nr:helix-turn-helix transcriptional regulator [Pseudomonas izuensis]